MAKQGKLTATVDILARVCCVLLPTWYVHALVRVVFRLAPKTDQIVLDVVLNINQVFFEISCYCEH